MIANRSAPPGPIVPVLIYADVSKAIDWLTGAFGFSERLRTAPEPDGTIHHAQLAVGEGAIILTGQPGGPGSAAPDDEDSPSPRSNSLIQSMYVPVNDVDGHFERAKQFGARVLRPPKSSAFGERQYTAEDLAGYQWTFSQSLSDVAPEEWGATVSEIKGWLALLPRPRLCYLEIPADDLRQSVAFYEKVFGWNIRHSDGNHPSFDDATGTVSGAWVTGRKISSEPGLLPYIWVDSINATLAQVVACGGEVIEAPQLDSPGGEWIAKFRDPAGNVIGLYQEGPR
jgi:predicted enzyme related to lactoylglutathione lyase